MSPHPWGLERAQLSHRLQRALYRRTAYSGRVARAARAGYRISAFSLLPHAYPSAPVARAFWFDDFWNFGDGLTPWLLRNLGVVPLQAGLRDADLVGAGSLIDMLPDTFTGAVWGTGLLHGRETTRPQATWLAVRGELTRSLVGAPGGTALGDPGLLASRFVRRVPRQWRVGLIPHHVHREHHAWAALAAQGGADVRLIEVRRGPAVVIREISACDVVVSTSLHGLITADAFGIPAVWSTLTPHLRGGDFKFLDHESAVAPSTSRRVELADEQNLEVLVRRAAAVSQDRVRDLQEGLERALSSHTFPTTFPPLAIFPRPRSETR